MEIKHIRKRDGSVKPFEADKISNAVLKAFKETGEGSTADAEKVASLVHEKIISMCVQSAAAETDSPLAEKCVDGYPAVEEIQDLVESALMEMDYFETAK